MSDFDDLLRVVVDLKKELANTKRQLASMVMIGTVPDQGGVDAEKGTVRLSYGKDENGKDILGPKIPWLDHGGTLKTWNPPSPGQIMMTINPGGNQRQGFAIPAGWSDKNPKPHNKAGETVRTNGQHREQIDVQGNKVETMKSFVVNTSGGGHLN